MCASRPPNAKCHQDEFGSSPALIIVSEVVEYVDHSTYIISLVNPGSLASTTVSPRIHKVLLASSDLRCAVNERSIHSPNDKYSTKRFALYYSVDMKHGL